MATPGHKLSKVRLFAGGRFYGILCSSANSLMASDTHTWALRTILSMDIYPKLS